MSGHRKVEHRELEALLKTAVSIEEHEEPLHKAAPGQAKVTRKKMIEVPYTETIQVPVHSKVKTKGHEERVVTGVELVPVQKFKEVKETVIEYKEEKVKGVKEVWVKKEVPYEKVVRKPVEVVKTKRVPYTDYEEKEVRKTVKVPCDKLEVKTGYREDTVTKTKLVEVEQDLDIHHGPVVVREGTPRMREIPGGGRNHGTTQRGKGVYQDGHRMRTGPDKLAKSASMPALPGEFGARDPGGSGSRSGPLSPSSSVVSAPAGPMREWNVNVSKPPDEAFGMKFDCSDGETIVVTKVKPASFMENWNAAHPDQQMKRGDRIVEVNGIRGNAKRLMDACTKSSGPIHMTIQGRRDRTPTMGRGASLPQL